MMAHDYYQRKSADDEVMALELTQRLTVKAHATKNSHGRTPQAQTDEMSNDRRRTGQRKWHTFREGHIAAEAVALLNTLAILVVTHYNAYVVA